jgi:cyclopropane-fatty-acyl-phospholipid synthase
VNMKINIADRSNAWAQLSLLDRFARSRVANWVRSLEGVELRLEDGLGTLGALTDDALTVYIHHPQAYRQIAFGGSTGAGEAFMDGHWTTNDLTGVCRAFASQSIVLDSMDSGLNRLKTPFRWLQHAVRRNTRTGSRRNIRAHYDLSNTFFAEFLDPTMTYSSGYFEGQNSTMEEASIVKYERLCRHLALKPTDHLLEIGCGWGGFACYAAKTYGCRVTGITLSNEQFQEAQKRVIREGLQDLVIFRVQDYRDVLGQFDKIVSIEMIEAVGPQYYGQYFRQCAKLLRPDGLFAIQAITIPDQMYDFARRNVDFIKQYIFPGGGLPSVAKITELTRNETDLNVIYQEDFGAHYARTLSIWHNAFLCHESRIRELGFEDSFIRMWRFYLSYCEAGFAERLTGVSHIVFAKSGYRAKITAPDEIVYSQTQKDLVTS